METLTSADALERGNRASSDLARIQERAEKAKRTLEEAQREANRAAADVEACEAAKKIADAASLVAIQEDLRTAADKIIVEQGKVAERCTLKQMGGKTLRSGRNDYSQLDSDSQLGIEAVETRDQRPSFQSLWPQRFKGFGYVTPYDYALLSRTYDLVPETPPEQSSRPSSPASSTHEVTADIHEPPASAPTGASALPLPAPPPPPPSSSALDRKLDALKENTGNLTRRIFGRFQNEADERAAAGKRAEKQAQAAAEAEEKAKKKSLKQQEQASERLARMKKYGAVPKS